MYVSYLQVTCIQMKRGTIVNVLLLSLAVNICVKIKIKIGMWRVLLTFPIGAQWCMTPCRCLSTHNCKVIAAQLCEKCVMRFNSPPPSPSNTCMYIETSCAGFSVVMRHNIMLGTIQVDFIYPL